MTEAQKRLVQNVKEAAPKRFALRVCNNGFRTADALIAQGVLKDATLPSDCTRFVMEA